MISGHYSRQINRTPPDAMTSGESQWIMNAINRVDDNANRRAEGQDERLRTVETSVTSLKTTVKVWIGVFAGLTALLQLVFFGLRFVDISLK